MSDFWVGAGLLRFSSRLQLDCQTRLYSLRFYLIHISKKFIDEVFGVDTCGTNHVSRSVCTVTKDTTHIALMMMNHECFYFHSILSTENFLRSATILFVPVSLSREAVR
jgi:hypothetical protein